MKTSVIEEVSDQSSIRRELHWVRRRLQYDDRPVIAVHQRSTAEDVIAPATAMLVRWDDLSARRQVGGRVARVGGHGGEAMCGRRRRRRRLRSRGGGVGRWNGRAIRPRVIVR
jgi:hypothetical protein